MGSKGKTGKTAARSATRSKTPAKAKASKDRSRSRTQSKTPRAPAPAKQQKTAKQTIALDELIGTGHKATQAPKKQAAPAKQQKAAPAKTQATPQLGLDELMGVSAPKARTTSTQKVQPKPAAHK